MVDTHSRTKSPGALTAAWPGLHLGQRQLAALKGLRGSGPRGVVEDFDTVEPVSGLVAQDRVAPVGRRQGAK